MCGISGIIFPLDSGDMQEQKAALLRRLQAMSAAQSHRGPDGEGYWTSEDGRVGFGHRRLAVIDLSREAAQPMHYGDRYSLVYNGEIYNYIEIRETLEKKGYRFRTQSDAEVLLACYDCYREDCLQHLDGMFALAIWDAREKILFAARDRFGEKPFYYAFLNDAFCFASERKALWAAGVERKINHPLLINFLVIGNTRMPLDRTIGFYQECFSLPPAHFLKVRQEDFSFSLHSYWDCDKETTIKISEGEAVAKWQEQFLTSIRRRLRSDVKLGTSLSGGLDSSSVVAGIEEIRGRDQGLETFSAVYPGFERDESGFISTVTESLGVSNYRVTPDASSLIHDFEAVCHYQEEPFSSASVYAQYSVFKLAASRGVTVLLDGQGADEILAGYIKYIPWYLQELLRSRPRRLFSERRALAKNGISFSWGPGNWLAALFPAQASLQLEKREAAKIRRDAMLAQDYKESFFDRQTLFKPLVTKLNDQLYFDCCQSGLEELLRYADRNSMAHGRELRLPFLNHELVEYAFRLPAEFKIRNGWTKYLLRKSNLSKLPPEIIWRKDKVGFEPPQKKWMENKEVQDYIMEAKKILVDSRILKPSILNEKIQPRNAYEADNRDWRYMVAAAFVRASR